MDESQANAGGGAVSIGEDYRVRLDSFEGPMDLLLFLIRRAEVDIHDIPIASIARQYLDFLGDIDRIDIEQAGEFLVMSATLMEIKSRMLQPVERRERADDDSRDDVDPRAELVRQLLAYKTYRDAGDALEARRETWLSRYPAGGAGIADAPAGEAQAEPEIDLEDLGIADLVEAFERIYEAVNFERLGDHMVTYDDTPLELHAEDLVDQLGRYTKVLEDGSRSTLPLEDVFRGRTRGEMLGLFLAMLELTRQRRIRVAQDADSGRIAVTLREVDPEEAAAADVDLGDNAEDDAALESE